MGHWVSGKYYKTMTEVAKEYGLSVSGLSRRMSRNNMTIEEAVLEFKPKTLEGNKVILNGVEFDSCTAAEERYGLPDNSLSRTMQKTGWPPEVCIVAIQRNMHHSKLYAYEGNLYFSQTELAEAHGITQNNLRSCMTYHDVDCITALEIRLGKIKPPKKQEEIEMNTYRIELKVDPVYIKIKASSEEDACEKANEILSEINFEQLGEIMESGDPHVSDIELSEDGPDTSLER